MILNIILNETERKEKRKKKMKFEMKGDRDCPIAEIRLDGGESVKIETGAMAYMQNIELKGRVNSRKKGIGSMLGAIGRSVTSGESLFVTHAYATGPDAFIGVAPAITGTIHRLECGERQYRLNTGAFLASDESVSYAMRSQNLGKAIFGHTGGFFVMETEGEGDMLINAFGDLMVLEVTPDAPLTVDNEHVIAWDRSLDYHIRVASGMIGFTSGEGLVNTFTGNGHVIIQTRNIRSLANALSAFLPNSDN